MIIKKAIAVIVLILSIVIILYTGRELAEAEQVYQEGAAAYEDMRNSAKKSSLTRNSSLARNSSQARKPPQANQSSAADNRAPLNAALSAALQSDSHMWLMNVNKEGLSAQESNDRIPGVDNPTGQESESSTHYPYDYGSSALNPQNYYVTQNAIDFGELKAMDVDAAAWLYSPGTAIDYPVMKADDYSYYLNHLPDGRINANGALFIDYNCAPDFSDELTVIYGHNMKSGKMFGSLTGYKNQDYYDKHPYMYLYAESGDYRIELMYGCVIGAGQWRERAFMCAENVGALFTYGARHSTFSGGAAYQPGDRIVALSTCTYEFDDARYLVIGRLRPIT